MEANFGHVTLDARRSTVWGAGRHAVRSRAFTENVRASVLGGKRKQPRLGHERALDQMAKVKDAWCDRSEEIS